MKNTRGRALCGLLVGAIAAAGATSAQTSQPWRFAAGEKEKEEKK